MVAVGGVALMSMTGCAGPAPNERQIGSGGSLVRYSSAQVEVDLTEDERKTLRGLRDRQFSGATPHRAIDASAAALSALGYGPVTVDRETGVIEAGLSRTLIPKSRQLLRGVLRAKIGLLPARPDHERLMAIVAVRAGEGGQGALVRVRFDRTVWDSNGDSRTKVALEQEIYDGFFGKTAKLLCPGTCTP